MLWKKLEGEQFTYKYYLKKLLGVGSFGAVFSADEVIGDHVIREVAVKVMQVDPDNKKRQLDELVTSTRLKYPTLLDCITPEQTQIAGVEYWGLVMELAQGSLVDYLKKGTLNNANLEALVKQISEALQYLHNQGIVHRDVKPANILSVNNHWKLADFGIVRMLDVQKSMTATSTQIGTKIYMPPESYDGEIRFAWDWWSLGIIIIEAFTGKFAFGEYTAETQLMKKVLMEEATIPNTLSPALQEIVRGCLIKDSKQRWTAQKILDTLDSRETEHQRLEQEKRQRAEQEKRRGQSFTETLPNGIQLEMIAIPEGSFIMGGTEYNDEKPQHLVNISRPFYIGKYPITQEQYQAVMGNNPSHFKKGGKYPVEQVSWEDAQAFCQKLSKIRRKTYRLPSETEWEYACRAGTQTRYYFGDNDNQLKEYAWYGDNSNKQTHPVGEKKPNNWGLYDMLGNVWEWCEDDWHSNYNGAPKDGRAWIDNDKHYKSGSRIVRGGSWYNNSRNFSCFWRNNDYPARRNYSIGFRVVW